MSKNKTPDYDQIKIKTAIIIGTLFLMITSIFVIGYYQRAALSKKTEITTELQVLSTENPYLHYLTSANIQENIKLEQVNEDVNQIRIILYSDTCERCHSYKEKVYAYAKTANRDNPIYFINQIHNNKNDYLPYITLPEKYVYPSIITYDVTKELPLQIRSVLDLKDYKN